MDAKRLGVLFEQRLHGAFSRDAIRHGFIWDPEEMLPVDIYDMSLGQPLLDIKLRHATGSFDVTPAQRKAGVLLVFYRATENGWFVPTKFIVKVVLLRRISDVKKMRLRLFLRDVLKVRRSSRYMPGSFI